MAFRAGTTPLTTSSPEKGCSVNGSGCQRQRRDGWCVVRRRDAWARTFLLSPADRPPAQLLGCHRRSRLRRQLHVIPAAPT